MQQITVLGAGRVGGAMIADLARDGQFQITAIDRASEPLDRVSELAGVQTERADLADPAVVQELADGPDLVICAVPGFMGYRTLQAVIEGGADVVDISFFPEDPFGLESLAQERGVTAVVDCGVAPGLCNVMAGHVQRQVDRLERYVCLVGGLPCKPEPPYRYKAVFSPIDVIEEYTRPARLVEFGKEVVRPALTEIELVDLPGVGLLEAFNTDGLRSLQHTLNAPFMKEKTLRYPGHADLMQIYRDSGFFDKTPIDVDGVSAAPLSVVSKLMFESWHLTEGEEDLTVMQVVIEGVKGDDRLQYQFDLLDYYHRPTATTSMARTTGYTATLVARMVLDGTFSRKGISPPEYIGRTRGCYERLLEGYAERGISVTETLNALAD